MWGHMLTFLGGPHACIGYRFALIESVQSFYLLYRSYTDDWRTRIKALLFTLIRGFEFELAVPADTVKPRRAMIVQRPVVEHEGKETIQMPIIIRPLVEHEL